MKTRHCVILLVSIWAMLRYTRSQQFDSKESAEEDEIRDFNESFISDDMKSKSSQGIVENLNIVMEEAVECKEDLMLSPEKIKEIRFLLHYGTHGLTTEEWSTSPGGVHGNFGLKKFAGTDSRKEAQERLAGINYFVKINGWSNEEKLPVALRHLDRAARGRLILQLNAPNSWTNFQRHFYESYITEKSDAEKWQKLVQRLQEKSEPTMTYFADKLSLCKAVGLDFDQTKEQILFGILSYEVYIRSAGSSHVQVNCLLKHVLETEKIIGSKR